MPACPRCNKRPVKRFCPALRTKICAVCCARERMIEISCPESCPYLINARATAVERERELRKKEGSTIGPPDVNLNQRALICIQAIERALVDAARGVTKLSIHDLDDTEICASIENAVKNLETEESGLIYEHRASTFTIDQLGKSIRQALDAAAAELPAETRPRRSDMLKALTFERDAVKRHIQRGGDREALRSYLHYVSLFYPWPAEATGPLIV
jgi:hypothetical protein